MSSSSCADNCQATQTQAINYMNNETLWALIIVKAWQDGSLVSTMQALQGKNANDFLRQQAAEFKKMGVPIAVDIPEGVETRIVVDTANVVHLVMPASENIPARSVSMVPHAI